MIKKVSKTALLISSLLFLQQPAIGQENSSLAIASARFDISPSSEDSTIEKEKRFKAAGRVFKNLVLSVPHDFSSMGSRVRDNWLETGAYAAGVGLLILADKPLTRFHQDVVEKHIDYKLPELPNIKISEKNYLLGRHDAYLVYSLAGLYTGSLIANYTTGQRAALNSFKAMAYSYVITQLGLKTLFARQRPEPTLSATDDPVGTEYTRNPYDFFNFRAVRFGSGGYATAFPSFHATAYYAVAQVLAMEFNNYWIPYGAATIVFFADLKSHQHWVSDMVGGGLLGSLIGHGIVIGTRRLEKRQKEKQKDFSSKKKFHFNYKLIPSVSTRTVGLNFFACF